MRASYGRACARVKRSRTLGLVHPLLALALILVAGIGMTRLRSRPSFALPASLQAVIASGALFVVLGLLLGPGLRVLDGAVLRALAPIGALGIGWIGAGLGTRLEWRMLRRIPGRGWLRGAALTLPVFAISAAVVWGVMRLVPELATAWRPVLPAILTLAAATTVSAGPSREKAVRRAGLLDTVIATAAAGAALILVHPQPVRVLVLTVLAGAVPAGLWLLARPRDGLALTSLILLSAGIAYAGGISPFVVCALLTALIASFGPPEARRDTGVVLRDGERVIYPAFLIVVGALLQIPTPWVLAAGVALAGLRALLRWATVRFGVRWQALAGLPPARAFVTMGQGAAAVAIAAGFDLVRGDTRALVTTVLVSVLAAEALAAALTPLTASPRRAEVT